MGRARTVLQEEGFIEFGVRGTRYVIGRLKRKMCGFGSRQECPLCGFTGWRFRAAGHPKRPGARCPRCNAAERHRLLWLYIENETDILHRDGELLYLAPMDQLETRLRGWRTVVTADLQMDSVDVHADITRLPFPDSSFETVVCLHVLEHVPHDQAAMAELYRVLEPGGHALLMVPKDKDRETTYEDWSITSPEGRLEAFGQEDHVRWYGRDFGDRLAEAGFSFSTATYGREVDEELVARFGLEVHGELLERNYEDIHHCVKEPTIERARPVAEHEARVEDVLSR